MAGADRGAGSGGPRHRGVLAALVSALVLVGPPQEAIAGDRDTGPGPASDDDGFHLPLADLLPPLVPGERGQDHAERCGADGTRCLAEVERTLAGWERRFGCDHRAVFPTVYRLLTREARTAIEDGTLTLDDPAGFGHEAVAFLALYEQMAHDELAGRPLPPAWQVAADAANDGDWTVLHDVLLAINAHVQRDMPFALAAVGLSLPDGRSRKPDHDAFNAVLSRAYRPIIEEVAARYDPLAATPGLLAPVDVAAASQLIQTWREGVWRNAERLSSGPEVLDPVTVATIEQQAHLSARVLLVGEVPGHREVRAAHCEAAAAARGDGAAAPTRGTATTPPPPRSDTTSPGSEATTAAAPAPAAARTASAAAPLPVTGGPGGLAGPVLLALALGRRRGGGDRSPSRPGVRPRRGR